MLVVVMRDLGGIDQIGPVQLAEAELSEMHLQVGDSRQHRVVNLVRRMENDGTISRIYVDDVVQVELDDLGLVVRVSRNRVSQGYSTPYNRNRAAR